MRFTTSLLLIGCAASLAGAQRATDSRASVTVGSATAYRGERVYGAIAIAAGVDSATSVQVAVIHGVKPGPTVTLVAGSHGTEYASIVAMTKISCSFIVRGCLEQAPSR